MQREGKITICRHTQMLHPQLIHKHGKPNLQSPNAAPSMKPKNNPITLIKLNNPKQTKKLTSNSIYGTGSLHVQSNSRQSSALPCDTAKWNLYSCFSFFSCFMCDIQESASTTISVSLNSIASEKELERREKQMGQECTCGLHITKNTDYWEVKLAFFKWVHMYILMDDGSQQ